MLLFDHPQNSRQAAVECGSFALRVSTPSEGDRCQYLNKAFLCPQSKNQIVILGIDPFFGFFPVNVPATQVLSSYSVIKPGYDVGAGFAIGTRFHAKLFREARYNHIFGSNGSHTDYLPISFGFRW